MFDRIKIQYLLYLKNINAVYYNVKAGFVTSVRFRRTITEKKNYTFSGVCISYKKRGICSSIIIRNVIALYPLEYTFNLYSPLIKVYSNSKIKTKTNNRKAKYYYLRKKPAPLSKVGFKYI